MKYLLRQKLLIGAVAGLAFAALGIAAMKPKIRHDLPPAPPPARDFEHVIAGSGITEPSSENIAIGTPLGGVVDRVLVQVGQTVKRGDPLFALDTRHLTAELAVRRAAETAAAAKVDTSAELLADLDDQLARIQKLDARNVVSTDETKRIEFSRNAARLRLREAGAALLSARAETSAVQTEIDRSTVTAPVDATVLQIKIRNGEFAAEAASVPLLILGQTDPLHVRVDVDENDAARVSTSARAYARPRGMSQVKIPLKFVRFEPLIIPKKSLTGDSTERVDTRVLQCLYETDAAATPLFVGQQVDVFIEDVSQLAGN